MSMITEHSNENSCRLCGELLIQPYATHQIFSLDGFPVLPVCSLCLKSLAKVKEIAQSYNLHWATLSSLGEQWMRNSGAWDYMNQSEGSLETYSLMEISPKDDEVINKDVMMGRTDPNIFDKEYHELLKFIMKDTYRADICMVLRAYCARNPNIGYCQGMSYVCMWLLIFLDKSCALWTLSFLVEKWLLPDFYIGAHHGNSLNGFYIESTTIAGLLEKCVPEISKACMPADQFSDFFSLQLLIQIFVNTVDLESCIFLWGKLMQESSIALIRGVVSLISLTKAGIANGQHPLNVLKTLTGKDLMPYLKEEYEKISVEVTEKRVNQLRDQAREYRARQWQKCEKFALRKLEKVSNFKQEEIKELNEIFMEYIHNEESKKKPRLTTTLPGHMRASHDAHKQESGIRKSEFVEIITGINPKLETSAGLIFDRFDEDRSGFLDFRELTICISTMCKGEFEDKLKVCFDVYDEDKSGYLQPNEMEMLIASLIKPYTRHGITSGELNIDEIQLRMRFICEKTGGILFFKDFLIAIQTDPMLYACFCDHFNIESDGIKLIRSTSRKRSSRSSNLSCRRCTIT